MRPIAYHNCSPSALASQASQARLRREELLQALAGQVGEDLLVLMRPIAVLAREEVFVVVVLVHVRQCARLKEGHPLEERHNVALLVERKGDTPGIAAPDVGEVVYPLGHAKPVLADHGRRAHGVHGAARGDGRQSLHLLNGDLLEVQVRECHHALEALAAGRVAGGVVHALAPNVDGPSHDVPGHAQPVPAHIGVLVDADVVDDETVGDRNHSGLLGAVGASLVLRRGDVDALDPRGQRLVPGLRREGTLGRLPAQEVGHLLLRGGSTDRWLRPLRLHALDLVHWQQRVGLGLAHPHHGSFLMDAVADLAEKHAQQDDVNEVGIVGMPVPSV
mmetsp:Transcript_20894/g.62285  ORF Transcript_20894/g.62285 Transcript_20894/m.62285 type:complete len:333 (+) Transcript_20894:1-999(+)